MTALDNIKAALEAGVTGYAHGDDWMAIGGNTVMLNSGRPVWARIATCEHAPNAAFIAACNPSAIRELLAYVESLEKDAARYRWLRDHKCNSLHLSRDGDHACNYMTASDWIDTNPNWYDEVPEEELQRMRESNTIWALQIYPHTPVGFSWWHGSTLDAAIDAAMEQTK